MPNGGLRPTPRSHKDFSLTRTFGTVAPIFDTSFDVGEVRKPQSQGDNLCTSEMVAEAGSDEYGIEMSSDWQAGKISLAFGNPIYKTGANMRNAVSTGSLFGFLPKDKAPFSHAKEGEAFICEWSNWPKELDALADEYKRPAYFKIDGPFDHFDNMRAALQKHKNTGMLGIPWYQSFNEAHKNKGIVPLSEGSITWHAVVVKGWVTIDDAPYLKIRSWSGKRGGKNSYYYFSREIYNQIMSVWGSIAYMYRDVPEDVVRTLRIHQLDLLQITLDLVQKLFLKVRYGRFA